MLSVEGLNTFHGESQALWDVSFKVDSGEIVALVGANGAGKSTTLRSISRVLRPASGSVTFLGERIEKLTAYKIVAKGISLVPEGRLIFPYMTIRENLEMGAYVPEARKKAKDSLEWVCQLFPILKERSGQLAGTLSGGEQQMLAIGRGLMSRPKLLMLDEPSLGLSPILISKVYDSVRDLHTQGITLLLVEQNVRLALEVADRGYVLETGRVSLEGKGEELLKDDRVKKAYLGI